MNKLTLINKLTKELDCPYALYVVDKILADEPIIDPRLSSQIRKILSKQVSA
jgi:hypothetical protein